MANVLVIAPHPDDEVLGVGGTMLRHLNRGDSVHVVICTRGEESRFGKAQVDAVQAEARAAHKLLGITASHFLDLPAARLDTVPLTDINAVLAGVFASVEPTVVYLPFVGDVHHDHQILFQSAMVCCRPNGEDYPICIYAYETISETDWYAPPITPAFMPNVFVDITPFIGQKLEAFRCYASQVQQAPNQRSIEALTALSRTRGYSVGMQYAEAFMLVRQVIST